MLVLVWHEKKTNSQTILSPRHGTLFFHDQDDVDNFVNNYEMKGSKQCSGTFSYSARDISLLSNYFILRGCKSSFNRSVTGSMQVKSFQL